MAWLFGCCSGPVNDQSAGLDRVKDMKLRKPQNQNLMNR